MHSQLDRDTRLSLSLCHRDEECLLSWHKRARGEVLPTFISITGVAEEYKQLWNLGQTQLTNNDLFRINVPQRIQLQDTKKTFDEIINIRMCVSRCVGRVPRKRKWTKWRMESQRTNCVTQLCIKLL